MFNLISTSSLLCQDTLKQTAKDPRIDPPTMSDDFTSRPPTKRVRSDQDHSKGETKAKEDQKQAEEGEEKDDADKNHEDEDWLSKPPFQVGASWDGWKTKWRQSCWCGKSEHWFFSVAKSDDQLLSCSATIPRRTSIVTVKTANDFMVSEDYRRSAERGN